MCIHCWGDLNKTYRNAVRQAAINYLYANALDTAKFLRSTQDRMEVFGDLGTQLATMQDDDPEFQSVESDELDDLAELFIELADFYGTREETAE